MLVLNQNDTESGIPQDCFADHAEPGCRFYLPDSLGPVLESDSGVPRFRLVRYESSGVAGGLFYGEFTAKRSDLEKLKAADPEVIWESVPCCQAWIRLQLRSHTGDETLQQGRWTRVDCDGGAHFRISFHLDKNDTVMLKALLEEGEASVEVRLRYHYNGLVIGPQGIGRMNVERFLNHPELGASDREWTQIDIVAFYLSLAPGIISFQSLEGEPWHSSEQLLGETALRSMDSFFKQEDRAGDVIYRFSGSQSMEQQTLVIPLHTARNEVRTHCIEWSVSDIYASLSDERSRRKHFPVVGLKDAFRSVEVHAVNSVPFDPGYVRRVIVDLRYTGGSGIFEHRKFRFSGEDNFRSLETRFPSINTDFRLESRVRVLMMPSDGGRMPTVWPRDAVFEPEPTSLVELTPARIGLRMFRIAAGEGVFQYVSRITGVLREAAIEEETGAILAEFEFNPDKQTANVALSVPPGNPDVCVLCVAHPPESVSADPIVILESETCPEELVIPRHWFEVLEPDMITIRLPSPSRENLLFAAVAFKRADDPADAEGTLRPFDLSKTDAGSDSSSVTWNLWRKHVFEQSQYMYRFQYVNRDAEGRTLPMQFGDWITESGPEVNLVHPLASRSVVLKGSNAE